MYNNKFSLGDRIVMIARCDGAREGMTGTVVLLPSRVTTYRYGVCFDEEFKEGHSIGGHLSDSDAHRGHYVDDFRMELLIEYPTTEELDVLLLG